MPNLLMPGAYLQAQTSQFLRLLCDALMEVECMSMELIGGQLRSRQQPHDQTLKFKGYVGVINSMPLASLKISPEL